ncbi:non-hydrolyzing UDP-N-acetylglucosamine 2-epimerase [Carnobacterium funditum]|uniref:non-hydrolyzing UDP-N-acetylglucosamine 2-epimerase n=1 Tax=Carnobacterium funditum TaxID=2752 RepID=UPI000556337D|nr:UDP-N-acetylglucosamine 2-epimerase (non-hydrolyzing) [Carnobacterium funditum]
MKKIKVMTVFGTRPEAIKMAPLVLELNRRSEQFESIVVVTAQHRQMLDQVLEIFTIQPDYDLDVMKDRQTLAQITASVLTGMEEVMKKEKPDIVLVHGDTTTTFAAGLSAFYNQVKVGHVEAGLRTWNKYSPFPEEMNRQVTDVLSDLYFAPTKESAANLLKENHPNEHIYITGNTAIDALKETIQTDYHHDVLTNIKDGHRLILMTMHRRENQGEPMERVFRAVRKVVDAHLDVEVVYPVHLNPVVQEIAHKELGGHNRIHLIQPLDVIDFHNIAAKSYFIMSDSGGVQEEAPSLGIPVLVLRDTTERPEGVAAGTLRLIGTKTKDVLQAMTELIDVPKAHQKMAEATNPYGDGTAAKRILDGLAYEFGQINTKPDEFKS